MIYEIRWLLGRKGSDEKKMQDLESSLSAVTAELAQLKEAVDRKRQLDVRREMRTDTRAASVQQYVIETCIDYRTELDQLELENKRLKATNETLVAHNQTLVKTLESVASLKDLLKYHQQVVTMSAKGKKNIVCPLCGHVFTCNTPDLCSYCQRWYCPCCVSTSCSTAACALYVNICRTCRVEYEGQCPNHTDKLVEAEKMALVAYYRSNRWKNPLNESSSESSDDEE